MPAEEQPLVQKAKYLFNKHFNLILLAVLVFAFIIRLKYMTVNAAVWWDEADYMSIAKHYALGTPEQAAPWRAWALPMVLSIFYYLGANEWFMHFLWVIFSVAGVYLTYLMGKKLYGKLVGIIAALGISVYFEFLFWTARFSLDVFVLFFWTLIAFLFWKGYVQNEGNKYLYWAFGLLGFGIFAYESMAFMLGFFFLFLIFTKRLTFLKEKRLWYALLIMLLVMVPFFAINQAKFGDIYPRLMHQAGEFDPDTERHHFWEQPDGKVISDLVQYPASFPYFLKWPFFILFIIGLSSFVNMFLGFDLIWKNKSKRLKKDLYIFIWGALVLILFSFILALTGFNYEPRFLMPMMPVVFMIVGFGSIKLYNLIKKHSPEIALAAVILLLVLGVYSQLTFADQLINAKKDSYAAENLAGTWLKEHSQPGDVLVGCGQAVQLIYYSEREFMSSGNNASKIEALIDKYKPKYFTMDGHDPGCTQVLNYPNEHPESFRPVKVFFMDEAQTQPIMIIYEIIYMQN